MDFVFKFINLPSFPCYLNLPSFPCYLNIHNKNKCTAKFYIFIGLILKLYIAVLKKISTGLYLNNQILLLGKRFKIDIKD